MDEILVLLFDKMTDYEVTLTMHLLSTSLDRKIVTIAYEDKDILSRSGAIYRPHRLVSEPLNTHAAGLIICGGWCGDYREDLHALIQALSNQGALLAGICGAGTFMLAKSGVLDDVKFTTPITEWEDTQRKVFGELDPFPRQNYINQRLVREKNVITAIGPAFIDFAVEICDYLCPFDSEDDKVGFVCSLKS